MTVTVSPRTMDAFLGNAGSLSVPSNSYLAAVQTNDGDSSYFQLHSSGGFVSYNTTFTGLPVGAGVVSIALTTVRRGFPSGSMSVDITHGFVYSQSVTVAATSASWGSLTSNPTVSAPITITNSSMTFGVRYNWLTGDPAVTYITLGITYSLPPNAPTITSPVGVTNSLSPTLAVSTSNPANGDAITHTEFEVRRVSDNAVMWQSGWKSGTSVAYGGTSLVSDVEYRIRARNRNTHGVEGAWSSYQTFTPNTNVAPTAVAVSPSGNIGTLTPTMRLQFNDNPSDTFSRYQIQARVSGGSNIWDTGWVDTDSGQKSAREVNIPYGGTPLNNAVSYQWRGRVEDHYGASSNYSSWVTFTPALQPDSPNIVEPSGRQDTLTPDISGEYVQGAGGTEVGWQYRIRQSGNVIYSSGDIVGAIADGQTYGTANAGSTPSIAPSLAWGTSYEISLRSYDNDAAYSEWSAWSPFHTNAAPTTPTNLSPSGSIINATTPLLSWTHNDPDGDAQTAAQVELREVDDDAAVTDYDPKTLEQEGSTHTVTKTLTASPATDYRWRVRTRGLEGAGYGPWSDWSTFTVATVPAFTITAPTPSEEVGHPALTVEWTFSGGSGTQQDYRVIVYASDQTTVVYDSDVQAGTADSFQIPSGYLKNGNSYYVQVSGRDTNDEASQSDKVFITTSWTLPATLTLTVTPIGSQD